MLLCQTLQVLSLVISTLNIVTGNVVLTSTVEENGRQYACDGEMVTFTCQVIGTLSLQWDSPLFSNIVFPAGSTAPRSTSRPFSIATLTSISGSGINTNYSSTLLVNASRELARSNTTVECRNQLRVTQESRFTVADVPAAPLSVTVNQVERVSGGGSVSITASWIRPLNYELFDIDRYDINVSSTSGVQQMAVEIGGSTNTTVTVTENPSNVQPSTTFSLTISARNRCGENGPTAAASYTLIDCGSPGNPRNGSVTNYTGSTNGSVAFYSCSQNLVPAMAMRAVCTGNGWSPNPADLSCTVVNCGMPTAPENGIIENIQSISTVGGAQIFFRCNPRYVPAGRMSATCVSPDGISAVGTWTSNPADLMCNATTIDCGVPTPASGVTVLEPHTTAVSSVIVYQCQSGFVPSQSSSVCGEDGEWSPDPSQVMCVMLPVSCGRPITTDNGSIDPYLNTTEGTEIFFRCNPGFVQAGRMRAVCGADGRWNPDPAGLLCNTSAIVCGAVSFSSGVTVEQFSSTIVGSEIFYQCQPGFLPEGRRTLLCGGDGRWNPDPRDLCTDKSLSTAATAAIAAFVCSLVTFITGTLCGALVPVCINRWNKKGHGSKPAPNTQEHQQAAVVYEEVDTLRSQKIELKENMAYGPVNQ